MVGWVSLENALRQYGGERMNHMMFRPISPCPMLDTRKKIDNAEAIMRAMPQVEVPVTHYFAHGTYGREITIPAGTLLTGKVHRHDDLNLVLTGECDVMTQNGWKKCVAGDVFIGKAGSKQIGYAHTDCRF